ncbi:MAG: lipid-A-disaccharide synthase [Chlamydiae bacterium]|nr:lipid-A-disaccharide synthase [Chlamydiota bacterium]
MAHKTTPFVTQYDLFLFAGEASGDLHGEALLQNLHTLCPSLSVYGVGGPRMRKQHFHTILPMEEFQVMGFVDVFFALPKLFRHFYFLARHILQQHPRAVLCIDYPGFSLRLERYLRKKGYQGKIIHYISPSVWAWGKKRIPLMEKSLDLLMTFFPFEKSYFSPSFPVVYVGHPLVTRIAETKPASLPWALEKKVISLFPGSRKKEILRNLPLQWEALQTLLDTYPDAIGAISLSQENFRPLLGKIIPLSHPRIRLVPVEETYALMQHSFMSIAKSGTVTLELALHKVPTVVTYPISPLDLWIARDLLRIRLPFYCIVNIAAGKEVFKELIGPNATRENLLQEALRLFSFSSYREEKKELCQELIHQLGSSSASQKAAKTVLTLL